MIIDNDASLYRDYLRSESEPSMRDIQNERYRFEAEREFQAELAWIREREFLVRQAWGDGP